MAGWLSDPQGQALLRETAEALSLTPEEVLTLMSYETAGTLDPRQKGPTTKWGQHEGLIQWGDPQEREYGVDLSTPEAALTSQLGRNGAVVRYALDRGFRPGEHTGLDLYSAINAGRVGRNSARDAAAGGAPGTVAEKYYEQMAGHRNNARRALGGEGGVGIGPTQARADAGLGLRLPKPPAQHGYAGIGDDRESAEKRARRARHDTTMSLLSLGQQLLNAA